MYTSNTTVYIKLHGTLGKIASSPQKPYNYPPLCSFRLSITLIPYFLPPPISLIFLCLFGRSIRVFPFVPRTPYSAKVVQRLPEAPRGLFGGNNSF